MSRLVSGALGLKDYNFRCDDDFFDRLTRRHTTVLLLGFSILVTAKQFVGEPIDCWCSSQLHSSHQSYADKICWIKNTYYVPIEEDIPGAFDQKEELTYYQWLPFILICQALLCYIPCMIWSFICKRCGCNIAAVMEAGITAQKVSFSEVREKNINYMTNAIDRYLMSRAASRETCCGKFHESFSKYLCFCSGRSFGNSLTCGYIFCKLLYIANAVGQLYLLDIFMGDGFRWYGVETFQKIVSGDDWTKSHRFPRVTMCDYNLRVQNRIHNYVEQCVLSINLFSEKIFLFIWFWFALLTICSILSFIKWAWNTTIWVKNVSYIKAVLRSYSKMGASCDKSVASSFVSQFLRRDGVFIIRLISNNCGFITSAEVLCGLWDNFRPENGGNAHDTIRSDEVKLNSFV